ncbi:hypothetical protein AMJ49_02810 [Parcubacteria bacterium DG_74_2]|nr:MAG: hypothetical protein AMJ49_02810 [Parcubacteria bacterium DG_74_2]
MKEWRINFLSFLIFLFVALILARLFFLQISQGDLYKALALGLHSSLPEVQGERGEIFLKSGEALAINKDFFLVFAVPSKIKNPEETAEKLSQILEMKKEVILEKFKSDKLYQPIKNRLSQEEINEIEKEKIAGIFLEKERGRYYPQEKLASQVIGFLDADQKGNYGLEEYYDEILKEGSSLILTVDYPLQFQAEKLLEKAKENLEIESGQIIVIDPYSGKILTMASLPSFDPNNYSREAAKGLEIFKNKITLEIFEPGSVFKSITMSAGLNEGRINPETTFLDTGFVKIGEIPIYNYDNRVWGQVSMTKVLENSINTGAVFVEKNLPHQIFLDYIQKFGIFKKTGVDLPEIYSENKEFKKGYEINFATASFGQGIEMTPLQLVRAYCAIANGGFLIKPYLVDKIVERNGEIIDVESEISPGIISPKTASQLKAMLLSVVENGYGKGAKIPGYYIAGKTGTAQISFSSLKIDKEGYSDKTWQTFIGFAPAFNPKLLIMVKLDNPKTKTAEYSAVPIFRELSEFIIHYYQIPHDYEID